MSTNVMSTLRARTDTANEVIALLTRALPDSLAHDGCEAIHLRRDQDDPNHIVSFTSAAVLIRNNRPVHATRPKSH
jgi:quinol monooxygenase YgiN